MIMASTYTTRLEEHRAAVRESEAFLAMNEVEQLTTVMRCGNALINGIAQARVMAKYMRYSTDTLDRALLRAMAIRKTTCN